VRSRRGALAGLALLTLAPPLACRSSTGAVAPLAGSPAKILLVKGYALQAILAQDRDISRTFIGRTTYVISIDGSRPAAPQIAGVVEPTANYASFAAFATDMASGRLPGTDHAVMYDIEKWTATPVTEQQHPLEYMARFSKLAKAHGLLPILAPARDLTLVHGGSCVKRQGENLSQAYIRCDLAGADADAAVLVVQSQVDQSDVPMFHNFLALAVKQARVGNRRIAVVAQLATAPLGRVASLAELVSAARSVGELVQGFSLNVRMADIPAAQELLRWFNRP